jgi:hypothetical protein
VRLVTAVAAAHAAFDRRQAAAKHSTGVPETRQLLLGGAGAKLGSAPIPLTRLSKIRCGANCTEPPKRNGIKRRSERERAFVTARFSGATEEQACGRNVAVGE